MQLKVCDYNVSECLVSNNYDGRGWKISTKRCLWNVEPFHKQDQSEIEYSCRSGLALIASVSGGGGWTVFGMIQDSRS